MQINDKFHEDLTPEAIDALLAELGAAMATGKSDAEGES